VSSAGRLIQAVPKISRSAERNIARAADDEGGAAAYRRIDRHRQGRTGMKQLWDRWAPLTGLLSVVCSFVGVMVALNQPQDKDSDAKIGAYFANHSHRLHGVIAFFVFLAGILLLLPFLAVLRDRLVAAEGQHGRLSALVFGAGVASVPFWGVSMLLANAPNFAANETAKFRLDPNTFRLLADTAYYAWVAAVMISALVVWGTSSIALRTGVLPRWYARLGIVAGVVQLFGFFFFPFFVWWVWIVLTSVLLVSRRGVVTAAAAQPAL
jgi:MFS family permease